MSKSLRARGEPPENRRARARRPGVLLLAVGLLAVGCATGERAYQRGDYQTAVIKACQRLRSDPDNEDAARILRLAYPAARQWHLENIEVSLQSQNPYRWEEVIGSYQQLNRLAAMIRATPAARRIFPNPRHYHTELDTARRNAAEVRYGLAEQLLESGEREDALRAVRELEQADELVSGYRDVEQLLEEAELAATFKVVINPTEGATEELDLSFFENAIHEFIDSYRPSRFVRFYSSADARRLGIDEPDQIINLRFEPFPLNEVDRLERQTTYEKDDVLVGHTRSKPPEDVFGTVKAKVTTFYLDIETNAELDLAIVDFETGRVVRRRRLPGRTGWEASWGTYRGDERAVPDDLLPLMERLEPPTPSHQELFEYAAEDLYEQAVEEIRDAYRRVK